MTRSQIEERAIIAVVQALSLHGSDADAVRVAVHARAPGRINLIGEHVDYVGGRVLPAALPLSCHTVLVRCPLDPRKEDQVTIVCAKPNGASEVVHCAATASVAHRGGGLATFVHAAIIEAARQCAATTNDRDVDVAALFSALSNGTCIYIEGNVPMGAGLSSSAALCVSLLFALVVFARTLRSDASADNAQFSSVEKIAVARAARRIENEYCGVQCGIMDQFVSVHAVEGSFLALNCDTLECTTHSLASLLGDDYMFVLVNSMNAHALGEAYNVIRRSIEDGQRSVGVHCFEDPEYRFSNAVAHAVATGSKDEPMPTMLRCRAEGFLSDAEYRCCSYVVEEMHRTYAFLEITDAVTSGRLSQADGVVQLGALLNATHCGLSTQLKVSTDELDFIQSFVVDGKFALGARLMGGGFGGCCLVLVERRRKEELTAAVAEAFAAKFGMPCDVFDVDALGGGASIEMVA